MFFYEYPEMNKRTDIISLRVTTELRRQFDAFAAADEVSLSEYLYQVLAEHADKKRVAYDRLTAAFAEQQGKQSKPSTRTHEGSKLWSGVE